jgi:hypothetical protein
MLRTQRLQAKLSPTRRGQIHSTATVDANAKPIWHHGLVVSPSHNVSQLRRLPQMLLNQRYS